MKIQKKIGLFSLSLCLSFFGITFADSSFLTSMSGHKTTIEKLYDTNYQTVYKQFQSTALPVLKSINYQSLVCLGVMSDSLFIQQMQSDIKSLKLSFLNNYNRIYADAVDIEQKHTMEKDTSVALFVSGSSYEIEKARLSGELMSLVSANKEFAQSFLSSYQTKIVSFVQDVNDYTQKNQLLISGVSSKILKLQLLTSDFQKITDKLSLFRDNLAGTGKQFFSKLQTIKQSSLSGLDISPQSMINTQVKKYRILKTLSGELLVQKDYSLGLFGMMFDEKLNLFLSQWYDNKQYLSLKAQLDQLYQKYAPSSSYQCKLFVTSTSFDFEVNVLQDKITSYYRLLSLSGVQTTNTGNFQTKVLEWFTLINKEQENSKKTFSSVVSQKTTTLLNAYKKQQTSSNGLDTGSTNTSVATPIVQNPVVSVPGFQFTKPFTLNQKSSDIKILQQLLTSLGFYTGDLNSTYTKQTKNALYQFQLANGLLKGYEKKPQTWGWMGPSTRAKLNTLLQ